MYSMLRNQWAAIDSTRFGISMQQRAYSRIHRPMISENSIQLTTIYQNILKGHREHIAHFWYQIFRIKFKNLSNIKSLILFHKLLFPNIRHIYLSGLNLKLKKLDLVKNYFRYSTYLVITLYIVVELMDMKVHLFRYYESQK